MLCKYSEHSECQLDSSIEKTDCTCLMCLTSAIRMALNMIVSQDLPKTIMPVLATDRYIGRLLEISKITDGLLNLCETMFPDEYETIKNKATQLTNEILDRLKSLKESGDSYVS